MVWLLRPDGWLAWSTWEDTQSLKAGTYYAFGLMRTVPKVAGNWEFVPITYTSTVCSRTLTPNQILWAL